MMKKIKLNDFLFLFAVISVFLLLIWKSHIGIANIDETFHLSVPYRMTQGDWLIVDEWHVSQMWSFLLYPLMKIYRMIVQDTEGIVLAFRQMFVVFQLTIMSISYLVLRKRYNFLAVVIPILYGMFVPFNIINFNYNSLGYAITYLLVIFNLEKSDKNYKYIMNGILLAGLVLCNPYTVFIYMIWLIWMLARWDKKSLLWTHMGIFFIAVLFLGLTLSKASFADLLNNLPNILSDAAHEPKTFYNFLEPFIGFIEDYWWYIGMFVITTIMAFRDKKRSKWWLLWLGLFSLMVVWFFSLRSAMRGGIGMNVIMLPLTLFGFVLFVFLENKNWHLFRVALVFPVLYTLCMNMSSNLGMFVIGSGCAVSSIMTMVFFEQWLDENDIGHKYAVEILVFVVIAQLGAEANVKVRHAFWEDNVADLKCEIEVGPMRGLKTTAKKKEEHEKIIYDILNLGLTSEDYVLYYQYFSWGYLVTDAKFGIFSAWTEAENALYSEKFVKYYELNPEKIPNVIYIDVEGYQTWTPAEWETYCQENGYSMSKTDAGNHLLKKN